ncbi:transposase [Bacillus cereus]|uniref:transposase n=1 Tax=Bacillus cereus group TaxID=86661 RepID=UPI000975E83B|nr:MULTISPECIES: transposase [Bacillus cereus group]MCS6594492.1 transposase [Bacillus cereus]ONG97736.1 transposase [Bacillus cereus]TEA81585.1 transposase [Bacillus thuringiensis F14-1]
MNKQDIIKHLHQSVIRENLTAYRELFLNTNINEVTDPYWKEALKFYTELSNENKDVLFKIIEQIEVDTLSTVLGVIDEGVMIEDKEVEFELTINDNNDPVNGDLQDLFLEYDEENR